MAVPLRKLLGVVALTLGLACSVGTANAAASTRIHASHPTHVVSHVSHGRVTMKDWWW